MFDLKTVGELKAPAHSLVASTTGQDLGDGKWENGVTFTNRGCYHVDGYCLLCEDAPTNSFTDQECTPVAEFKPFELDLGTSWMPQDNFPIDEVVEEDFETGTSSRLEAMIWDGCDGGTNPTLGGGTSLGTALAPKAALGTMMAALIAPDDHIGAHGTIYMSPRVAVELVDLLREDDGKLYTAYGKHLVILGAFPTTHIAGHIGEPMVWLGEIRQTEALDDVRRNNTRPFRVQRSALVAWNTCAAFVQQVTLP